MVVWSTAKSLSGADANLPVLISELKLGAALGTNDSSQFGLDHFLETFTPHKAQPAALTTRAYMNVVTMIVHQGTTGHLCRAQARATR
jgi:hypothetical protein